MSTYKLAPHISTIDLGYPLVDPVATVSFLVPESLGKMLLLVRVMGSGSYICVAAGRSECEK
jgi:hypothetical protein